MRPAIYANVLSLLVILPRLVDVVFTSQVSNNHTPTASACY
ncbi:MAG: hypothetical protein AB4911_23890 [Oscillochloridaceae bacterium umkhey_bin13]